MGHTVPAGGIGITGQEQTQTGGGFLEGEDAPKGIKYFPYKYKLMQLCIENYFQEQVECWAK